MVMESSDIVVALTAVQSNLAKYLAFAFGRGKAAVIILNIPGCHDHIIGDFDKLTVIAAIRANNAPQRLSFGYLDFLHNYLYMRSDPGAPLKPYGKSPRLSAGLLVPDINTCYI